MRPNPLNLLLLMTFLETIAEAFTSRGIFFYTTKLLHYTGSENLGLAFAFGTATAIAALTGHPLVARLGERRGLALMLLLRAAGDLIIFALPTTPFLVTGGVIRAAAAGGIWPVIENYISAGRSPADTGRVLGWFNATWAFATLPGLLALGYLMPHGPTLMFLLGAGGHVIVALLTLALTPRSPTLAHDDPARLPAADLPRFKAMLRSARFSQFQSSMLFNVVITALLPGILMTRFGYSEPEAAMRIAGFDAIRLAVFITFTLYAGWHGHPSLLAAIAVVMPIGASVILLGAHEPVVLAGVVAFGFANGAAYYSGLYYGMVVHAHSVEAAGVHEGLGALGSAVGPGVGIAGNRVGAWLGKTTLGTVLGIGSVSAACSIGVLWSVWKARRERLAGSRS